MNVQNEHMIKQVCFQVNISRATDFYKNAVNGEITQRDEPYSTFASEDLLDILELGIGARAMLVRNINTDDGLVNGAFGTITGLEKVLTTLSKPFILDLTILNMGKNISPS